MRLLALNCVLVFLMGSGQWASAKEFFVSPLGSDSGTGDADKPFQTIARAQKAVREFKSGGSLREPIRVLLKGGTYHMSEPLTFSPEDSGKPGAPITYEAAPGEKPVLNGGKRLSGWRKGTNDVWTTDIPEVKSGNWHFNELFFSGKRSRRARIPNSGFLKVAGCPEGTPKTVGYHTDCQSFQFKAGDLRPDWTNLRDVEVIVYHFWTDSHLPIAAIDTVSNIVTFTHKAGKTFTDDFSEDGARYIVENVYEGLDEPGEWYLNRQTGVLSYKALPGEDVEKAEVYAPFLKSFVRIEGSPVEQRFVEHVWFRGISFQYCSFELPPGNSNDQQGSASVTAAVTLAGARHCRFEDCEFRNLGTWAVEIGRGCSYNTFTGNEIAYVAAGGFRLNGGTERNHPLERNGWNTLSDNRLHHYGQVYPSAVGILLMNTEHNLVSHNAIHDGFYTGISVGWVWGYQRSISQGNRIEFNHIHNIGQGLLSDMGGVYTLGVSPGTVLRNNLIHDVDANHYGGWGIYHDEGSTHLLVESNIVYNTKFAPFNIHFAKEVTVRNNIFALGRLEQVSRTKHEPHKSVFFENNIVYWKTGELFSKDWKDEAYTFHLHPKNKSGTATLTNTFECDYNLYFKPDAKIADIKFAAGSWDEWRKRGKDTHSLYADPQFRNPDAGDFTMPEQSPAWGLGFKSIDMSNVGPRKRSGEGYRASGGREP